MPRGQGRSDLVSSRCRPRFFMPKTGQAERSSLSRTVAVVPARYNSKRLPGKVLAPIAGHTMLEHVWCRTNDAETIDRVIVATDDERVRVAALAFAPEGDVLMTSSAHVSGSDRVAEVAQSVAAEIYVNVQADLPLLDPTLVDATVRVLISDPELGMATAAVPVASPEEMTSPNVVKVVVGADGRALYFSRAPIPYDRDNPGDSVRARHHVGIYAFRRRTLLHFAELDPSALEHTEGLEQLRALENGIAIGVALVESSKHLAVDSSNDLEAARQALGGRDG